MSYALELEQEQRLIQEQCIEEIYLDGIGDGADGRLPAMAEIIYLQGYCEGMRQLRMRVRCEPQVEVKKPTPQEFPLLCGQCNYLSNRRCTIKDIVRDQSNFACPQVSVDCPF